MRDSWWNEQLLDLSSSNDFVMQTLADGLVRRKLLKTIQTSSEDEARDRYQQARAEAPKFGYQDVDYFVHLVNRPDKRAKDVQNALPVATFDGRVIPLADAFLGQQSNGKRFGDSRAIHLVVLPGEVRDTLLPPS